MSDILLDRIKAHRSAPDVYDAPTFNEMADRIEELEANALANRVAIMRLEAKLAKAVEALRVIEDASRFFARDRESSDTETLSYAHETTRRFSITTMAQPTAGVCFS